MIFKSGLLYGDFRDKLQEELKTKDLDTIINESKLSKEAIEKWKIDYTYPDVIETLYVILWIGKPIEYYLGNNTPL